MGRDIQQEQVKERGGQMNKSQLIEALAKAENLTIKKAEMVVNTLFDNMTEALVENERIEIRGFGSLAMVFLQQDKTLLITTIVQEHFR